MQFGLSPSQGRALKAARAGTPGIIGRRKRASESNRFGRALDIGTPILKIHKMRALD